MEKTKIDKERTWIYSPVNNIVIKVDIEGILLEEQLKEAIKDTVNHYDMFHQKIILDNEGNAYYQKTETRPKYREGFLQLKYILLY